MNSSMQHASRSRQSNESNKDTRNLKLRKEIATCASRMSILHASVSNGYDAILLSAFTTLSAMYPTS